MKRKSKLILMRKGGSSPVGDLVPTQRRTPKDFCFMQEKSLEPKEALEDERGVQGLDEIEEWGIGVKVKIILEDAMPSNYLVAPQSLLLTVLS